MSEIEQTFEMVRGGQLHWFSAWFLHDYRLITYPKLGGEQRLEAEEIRRSSGGFRPGRSWKLHALCFSFVFGGVSVQSGKLTVHKITRNNMKNKGKWPLFIWLSSHGFSGWNVTICGIYATFLGITCVLPRSIVANYKQCKSSPSVSDNWRHAAVVCLCAM